MRFSFVLVAPVLLVVACGQSFSASPSDGGGGADGAMGADGIGGGDGSGPGPDGGGDATGKDASVDACVCMPTTCALQGAQCGTIEDGCGMILQCPDTCVAPLTCGGSGNATQCGCTAKTCTDLGWQCGVGTNLTYPHFYTCCSPGGIGTDTGGTPEGGATDAGTCNGNGPTPPEPGWSCIAASGGGWCCTQ